MLRALDIRDEGRPLDELLNVVEQSVDRPGINPASGFHFGYVPGGGVFATALGDYLAAASNRYAGIFFANPGAVQMENHLIRWMCRLIGYPDTALGNLTSGGSIANLTAIVAARDRHGIGPAEAPRAVVYLTPQTHHCVQKALRIAGLGAGIVRYIPTNERFQMEADRLEEQVNRDRAAGLLPFLVVGSAGTTDTGAVDPLDRIADIAEAYGLWYHVDAAYGGFFLLVDEVRDRFRGIERSDSLAIDPHKGLFLSYGIGAVLVRDVEALFHSHHYLANYMQDALGEHEELSPADLSPELTKHFRGLRMWLPLQLYGVAPFRAALAEKLWLCRYAYERLQELGFETGPYPELSILIFRYVPDRGDANAFNRRLIDFVQRDGRVFLSSTTIDDVFWIRLAVLSFRSHRHEVEVFLEVVKEGVEEVGRGSGD
jgi:glutamate/tyrosine decarboxylase-like PLP-dependent enzyme